MTQTIIGPQPGPQTKFLSTTADICIYGGSAGGGKGNRQTIEILTPFGFKQLKDLKVGDAINATDGTVQKIIGYYPKGIQQFYRLKFADGAEVDCDEDHIWLAWTAGKGRKVENEVTHGEVGARKWTTLEVYEHFQKPNARRLGIPIMSKPCVFNVAGSLKGRGRFIKRDLDPYTLGVLLGDGCITGNNSYPQFFSADEEIPQRVASVYPLNAYSPGNSRNGNNYVFATDDREFITDYLKSVGLYGTYSHTKFIPRIYLHGSVEERWELLRGLMDTDGYVDTDGGLYYYTTSKQLADDFVFLTKSLACVTGRWTKATHYRKDDGTKVDCKECYCIRFKCREPEKVFHLTRKKERAIDTEYQTMCNWIESIEKIDKDHSICISVSHPNSLYVCTTDFVVTHNTFSLLLEPIRHLNNSAFSAVIFRRTSPQITNPGGLWDESLKLYPQLGGTPSVSTLTWKFPSGMKIKFSHLEHEKDKHEWQGSQIPLIAFDEAVHFPESAVTYLMSRNRSDSGVPGYIRMTCNPDPTSWIRRWIDWYIGDDGLPIQARSGVLRYFLRINDEMVWGDSKDELVAKFGEKNRPFIKSFTFISATIHDNKILLEKDPNYLATLMSMPRIERERLLGGNWDVVTQGSKYFKRDWCGLPVTDVPPNLTKVRYWDRAATEPSEANPDPDWTVGILLGKDPRTGYTYVLDVVRFRAGPWEVQKKIKETLRKDGHGVRTVIEQDPGQAGKVEAGMLRRELTEGGYDVRIRTVTKDKLTRFLPFSAASEHGDIKVLTGPWNEPFFLELERFSGDGKGKDDQVDCCSGAYAELENKLETPIFVLPTMPKANDFLVL